GHAPVPADRHELRGDAPAARLRPEARTRRSVPDECEPQLETAGEPGRRRDDRAEVLLRRQPPHVEDVLQSPRAPRYGGEARGIDAVRDQVDLRPSDAR